MIYLDNASTTFPKPDCVYTGMDTFYRTQGASAGRSQYSAASAADRLVDNTRNQIKDLLKCNADYETVFTSTATEAINTILRGLDYSRIKTVYVTPFEHNAVSRTISSLQTIAQFGIIKLAVKRDPLEYDLREIKCQFAEAPPNLVVATHASNVCGLVTPIEEIALLAKKHNSLVVVDMAQSAGLIDTDLTAVGVDAAVYAGHKTLYGPFGASGFVMKSGMSITPLIYGGTGRDSANTAMPALAPERFEAGTRNVHAIAGLNNSLKWIADTGISAIFDKERNLKLRLLELLRGYRNINFVGENDGIGIVSCILEGYAPDDIGNVLNRYDIAVRTGLHCSPSAHRYLGTFPAGTLRFSLGYYNSDDDLDAVNEALRYIQENG